MKNKFFILSIVIAIAFLVLAGCGQIKSTDNNNSNSNTNLPPNLKAKGEDCQADSDCQSQVCNFIKQDMGQCLDGQCTTSDQAVALNGQISHYCDQNNQWQLVRKIGEQCQFDYQCLKQTCKDNPNCHPGLIKYYCKNEICVAEEEKDECTRQGLKRIIDKAEFIDQANCTETLEQREIKTVCSPCGDGFCNAGLESPCNCRIDCPKTVLTDQDLLNYVKSEFDKEQMMFKAIIIGYHNGIGVKASFPCSDVCPTYTSRIISYDLSLEDCEAKGGKINEVMVPMGIGVGKEKFCQPPIILDTNNN